MTLSHPIVFLLDVDNTLLDNDGIQQDLKDHLERAYGRDARDRYWKISADGNIVTQEAIARTRSSPTTVAATVIARSARVRRRADGWRIARPSFLMSRTSTSYWPCDIRRPK